MGGVIASLASVLAISTPVQAVTLTTFASGFSNPTGIAFDSSGNLFVANNFNSITKVGSGTRSTFATGLNNPSDLVFNSNGNLYVADTFNNRVKGFNQSGSLIFNTNNGLNQPRSLNIERISRALIVINGGGRDLVTYLGGSDGNFNLPGFFSATAGDTSAVTSGILSRPFTSDIDDRFLSETVRTLSGTLVKVINSSRRFRDVRLPDNSITLDLAFDQVSGNLYASDFANNVVYQVNGEGTLRTLISSGLNQPAYLAINGGNLYISDNGSGNILEFNLREIPFEFSPTLGLVAVGGFVVGKKLIKRKGSKK